MIEENDQIDQKDEEAGNATAEETKASDDSQVSDDQLDNAAGGRIVYQ